MAVSSPYAVFTAAELNWPPRCLESPPQGTQPRAGKRLASPAGRGTWSQVIQGELFQLA